MSTASLTPDHHTFLRDGFVVLRGFIEPGEVHALRHAALQQLQTRAAPLELETDLDYPGAPQADGPGAATVRRLLHAYGRGPLFQRWASGVRIHDWLSPLFGGAPILSLAHHNCVMTKHPSYGTATGWHQDIRYWSFTQSTLISSWLALGDEHADNGGLWFIPGSHQAAFAADQFDDQTFFRTDAPQNSVWLARAVCPTLAAGDVVFFHCRTLHSAHRNSSAEVKLSVVHTYHPPGCEPIIGTRSASQPEIDLARV